MTPATKSLKETSLRSVLVILLAVAFGYIEAAVVVYLRQIFHANGFEFPLTQFPLTGESNRLILVEASREAATLILIISASWLSGQNRQQRVAYFMIIFAVWDIFYYVFLKAILGWPASILDWDILFLIPVPWAGPVAAPILVSIAICVFAGIILYRDYKFRPLKVSLRDWAGFFIAGLFIIVSFCIAGRYTAHPVYYEYFSWVLFGAGMLAAVTLFIKCLYRKTPRPPRGLNNQ